MCICLCVCLCVCNIYKWLTAYVCCAIPSLSGSFPTCKLYKLKQKMSWAKLLCSPLPTPLLTLSLPQITLLVSKKELSCIYSSNRVCWGELQAIQATGKPHLLYRALRSMCVHSAARNSCLVHVSMFICTCVHVKGKKREQGWVIEWEDSVTITICIRQCYLYMLKVTLTPWQLLSHEEAPFFFSLLYISALSSSQMLNYASAGLFTKSERMCERVRTICMCF